MFMYVVYIIYSSKIKRFYIGTTDNFDRRLKEHNNAIRKESFTFRGIPWELFLLIDNLDSKQAYDIEAYLKRMKSSAYLKKLKDKPEILDWLREKFA
jgi:putative endonuclease